MTPDNINAAFTTPYDHQISTMEIYNQKSMLGSYFHMSVPFQITLEYCSGISDTDYFNFFMVSPKGAYSDTQSASDSLPYYLNRPLHQHNFYELMLVLKGEIIQKIEGKEYLYPAGTCCLINRNLRHAEKFISSAQVLFINSNFPHQKWDLYLEKSIL